MRYLILGLCSLTLIAGAACGGDLSLSTDPLSVSIQREPINTIEPIFRAFLNVRESKFTFVLPEKYSTSGDPSHGRLQFKTLTGDSFITVNFVESASSAGLGFSPEACRELLLERYPGGKILAQSTRPVAGRTGTMIEVEWKSATGLAMKTRAVYAPTAAGVIEFAVSSGAKKFKAAQTDLNSVIGTFAADVNGKLVVHHIGGPA